MKKALIFLFIIFANNVYSQSGWFTQNSGTTNSLWGTYFINSSTGYIVGSYSTLIKTTNSGINWFPLSPGIVFSGYNVTFLNEYVGYISCGGGQIGRASCRERV